MFLAHVAALMTFLVVRRVRGRGGLVALGCGVASGIAVLLMNRRRLKLQSLRIATTEAALYALFDERTAKFFARLPDAVAKLREKLGELEELGLESRQEKGRAERLKRLYDLSGSGKRKPYSEARKAHTGVPATASDLEEAERLLAFAEATYESPDIIRQTAGLYKHEVLFLEGTSAPGAPAHFLSFDSERKEAILSIRGTQTLSDVLTDLLQDIDEFDLGGGKKSYAHAGFLESSKHVLWRVVPLVRDLLSPMGYGLWVTGHSLGAGTAALVTRMLAREAENWSAGPRFVRCVCFAPPPCVDSATALSSDSITSLVCNDDCVPRMSLQNIGRLNLLAHGKDVKEVVKVGAERKDALAKCRDIPDLMVPGRVIVLHRAGDAPAAAKKGAPPPADEDEEEAAKWKPAGKWTAWLADGTLPEINYLELSPAGVAEHLAPVYREAIGAVLLADGAKVDAEPRAEELFADWLARAEGGKA